MNSSTQFVQDKMYEAIEMIWKICTENSIDCPQIVDQISETMLSGNVQAANVCLRIIIMQTFKSTGILSIEHLLEEISESSEMDFGMLPFQMLSLSEHVLQAIRTLGFERASIVQVSENNFNIITVAFFLLENSIKLNYILI